MEVVETKKIVKFLYPSAKTVEIKDGVIWMNGNKLASVNNTESFVEAEIGILLNEIDNLQNAIKDVTELIEENDEELAYDARKIVDSHAQS